VNEAIGEEIHLLILIIERKDGEDLTTKDDFDIALENADGNKRAKTDKKTPTKGKKRLSKDKKYGFGGKKRFAKSNTAESSDAIGGFNKMRKATSAKGGKRGKR
jgi:rRNA-processing protein EBP2